jgi:regulator of sigma E protease
MEILIKASQLILSLSILIVLHELGHFIPAKLFKTRVEKFYLFFDPWFSLFKKKVNGTEYGIGWIPLGGYVKISGMIDESMDKEQMAQPAQPWEFRSKPAWQRLIIMLGGVTVNVLVAIVIYIGILFFNGEDFLPSKNVQYGISCDSLALEMGLLNGDKIISVDGKEVGNFNKIPIDIIMNEAKEVEVLRNGATEKIEIPQGFLNKLVKSPGTFISPRIPFFVEVVAPGSPAEKAGFKVNDFIVRVNGKELRYFDEVRAEIQRNKLKKVEVVVFRNKQYEKLTATVSELGTLGLGPYPPANFLSFEHKEYTFLESIPAGIIKTGKGLSDYVDQFKLIFNSEVKGYESLGGFISFGKVFAPEWDWLRFWNLTAFFSVALAIMNVLPIPALDGGHVLFLLYEMITGRKPGEKFMEYAQLVGMILLLALLVFANGNDIVKLFK